MAAVAAELHRAGFSVTGSDSKAYPPTSTFLQNMGISILEGFKPENLPKDSLIVVGNAISRGNPELEAALDYGLIMCSLPELISRRFLVDKQSVVVSGTHGKTTTTAMLSHVLRQNGRDPGWIVGGVPIDLGLPCWAGTGNEFVIEGDEYDTVWYDKRPKFLHYKPNKAIITSIEFDHADIYANIEEIKTAFKRFVGLLPKSGCVVAYGDDAIVREISEKANCAVITYGQSDDCEWKLVDVTEAGSPGVSGEIHRNGDTYRIDLGLMGKHNLMNSLAVVVMAENLGVPIQQTIDALATFKGVQRRMQSLLDEDALTIWDDFAHHPTAIRETLAGVRKRYPERRICAVFEPRSNTMVRNFLEKELIEALSLADCITLTAPHRKDKISPEQLLDTEKVVNELRKKDKIAENSDTFTELLEKVTNQTSPGDIIVLMSNGGFGGIKDQLVELAARAVGINYTPKHEDIVVDIIASDDSIVDERDRIIECRECGNQFVFSGREQEFYQTKGFSEPKRCKECRSRRKREQLSPSSMSSPMNSAVRIIGQRERQWFDVVCAKCGKATQVPFKPTTGRPVFCRDCYISETQPVDQEQREVNGRRITTIYDDVIPPDSSGSTFEQ